MSYFVGIDVGGTTCTISVGNRQQEVVHISDQFPTRSPEGPKQTVGALVEGVQACMASLDSSPQDIITIGLATPGPATLDGMLLKTPNLKHADWDRFPIRFELEKAFKALGLDLAVHYIGDGQAAALGEFAIRKGSISWPQLPGTIQNAERLSSLFMIIVGTGLGGGEVRNSEVVRGMEGRAGHAGHMLLPAFAFRHEHDRQLLVGNATSTVESAVSLTGLTHQLEYRLTLDAWKDHPLNQEPSSIKDKAKGLRSLADNGDPLALEMFDDQARALGIALLGINYLGDYDALVIGGGVCDLSPTVRDRYLKAAYASYHEYALDGFRNLESMEYSVCGDEAPVIGALVHAVASHVK